MYTTDFQSLDINTLTTFSPYQAQREVDNERVNKIVILYKQQIELYNNISFEQPIVVCEWSGIGEGIPVKLQSGNIDRQPYAIVDGQHRVFALRVIKEEFPNFNQSIHIFVHKVNTLQQVKQIQTNLFKQKPVSQCDQYNSNHNLGTELNSLFVTMRQLGYKLGESGTNGRGCNKTTLDMRILKDKILNSTNHHKWIEQEIKAPEILDKINQIKDNQMQIFSHNGNSTKCNNDFENSTQIEKNKTLRHNEKVRNSNHYIVAIQFHNKYDELVKELELLFNIYHNDSDDDDYDSC